MAGDINQVILVGRICRDAELRYTATGTAICNFSIAVNRRVKKGDQWSDVASFFDLALWDKQAENLNKYLVKGTQVAIQGELRQDRWEKDGQKMSKVQVFVTNLQMLGGKREGATGGQQNRPTQKEQPPQGNKPQGDDDFDPEAYSDDIPW